MKRFFLLAALLSLTPAFLQALDYELLDETSSGLRVGTPNWEFGLGGGYAFVQGSPKVTQTTTNDLAIFGIPDQYVVVQVEGEIQDAVAIEAYAYRKYGPSLSLGFEGDYQFEHKIGAEIQGTTPILGPNYVTSHDEIFELTPAIKFGPWMGATQFYLVAAPGVASVHRQSKAHYTYLGQEYFFATQDSQKWYFMAKIGAGIEYALTDEGSLGADLRYHIIMTGDPLKMFVPTLHAAYHF